MVETSDQILRHIEAQRSQLSDHVAELENKIRTTIDWRVQMRRRPGVFIGLGIVLGIAMWRLFSKE